MTRQTLPIVALVGRPNVGKSTLFNRLCGKNLAIVHDAPGVTRDRHYADTFLHGRKLTLVDTGGFDPSSQDPLGQGIARQVEAAISEADIVVCVFDGTAAPTETDRRAVELLRRADKDKPVLYVANKVDNLNQALLSNELYTLGISNLIGVSALHGRGTADLEAAIVSRLPETEELPETELELPRVALLGRPNAGKSTLFNRLSRSERSLVDERPGTTRDPIDSVVEYGGRHLLLLDTAGIRKKPKVDRGVEAASVMRSLRAIQRAQVVVLMSDLSEGIAEQDARLLGLCTERRRALIIGANKLDLLPRAERTAALKRARDTLHFARWAPIVPLSAKTGEGVGKLMSAVMKACHEYRRRVSTGELNRFFETIMERHPPPTSAGRAPRIYYITQAQTEPPVFVAVSSAPQHIKASYKRFVSNQIRKAFGFESVPLYVHYKSKKKEPRS